MPRTRRELQTQLLVQMLGPSLLSYPLIIYTLGYAGSIIAQVFTYLYLTFQMYYIVECSHYTRASTYFALASTVIHPKLGPCTAVFTYIYHLGYCASLLQVAQDAISILLHYFVNIQLHSYVYVSITAGIMFVLCIPYRTGVYDRIFAATGPLLFVLLFTVIIYFANHFDDKELCARGSPAMRYFTLSPFGDSDWANQLLRQIVFFPVLQNNFLFIQFTPDVLSRIKGLALAKRSYIISQLNIMVAVSSLVYIVISYISSFMFGDFNTYNLFKSFLECPGQEFVRFQYLVYCLQIIFAFPISFSGLRDELFERFGLTPRTKRGYLIGQAFNLAHAVVCMCISFIQHQLFVYGIFSAVCGVVLTVVVPWGLFVWFPVVKQQHKEMDQVRFQQIEVNKHQVGQLHLRPPTWRIAVGWTMIAGMSVVYCCSFVGLIMFYKDKL